MSRKNNHTKAAKFAIGLLKGLGEEFDSLVNGPLIEWNLRGQQMRIDVLEALRDLNRDYPELFQQADELIKSEKGIADELVKNMKQPRPQLPQKGFEDTLIRH